MAEFPTRRPGWSDEQYAEYLAGAEAGRRRQGKKHVAELTFRARLGVPKVSMPKEKSDYLGARVEGGATEIALIVERPTQPTPPRKPQALREVDGEAQPSPYSSRPTDPGEFKPPAKKRGMSDELHAAKVAEAQEAYEEDLEEWGFWLASIERMREEYVAEKRAYEQGLAGVARSLVAYGQIPALAAVMGGLEVEVTIRPTGEGMLPGFVEQLLGLPAPTVATEEAAGGD